MNVYMAPRLKRKLYTDNELVVDGYTVYDISDEGATVIDFSGHRAEELANAYHAWLVMAANQRNEP